MSLVINRDTVFMISNESGDVPDGSELGLYVDDTRILREYSLTLNRWKPLLLTSRSTDSGTSVHFLTNPALENLVRGTLSIIRRRTVLDGVVEEIEIVNYGAREARFALELEFQPDAVHVIAVRQHLKRMQAVARAKVINGTVDGDGRLRFDQGVPEPAQQLVIDLCQQPEWTGGGCRFVLALPPRKTWHLCIRMTTSKFANQSHHADVCRRRRAGNQDVWGLRRNALVEEAPRLETDGVTVRQAYRQSVHDLATLRIKGESRSEGEVVIAAGIPWFMALFGRDSLIAAYQSLPFYPELAKGVVRALARLQGRRVDPLRYEEPGKILHEYRAGVANGVQQLIPGFPYFGTIDATPLFLMVLAAVYRVTGDLEFVRSMKDSALRALAWMDRYGDRDGDGYLEYAPSGGRGLANHGWKDSFDAVQFRDGTLARPPIALCEVQGYAYAARIGMAEMLDVLGEPHRAADVRAAAERLRERFERDFWLPEQSYYALALDAEKRPVDAVTSNPGHLLWSGIVAADRARLVAERLVSPELFSGWGVRTMATTEQGYNPISYHNGSVWPHDTSLIVAGLARYGLTDEAARLTTGLLATLDETPDRRFPEVFAGYGREEAPFPVDHPLTSRPQAWAAGSTLLLLSSMLGIDANAPALDGTAFLPTGVGHLAINGLWIAGQRTAIRASRGGATAA